jgi:energy-coupling factor transporter ATP-binding protein EcfA2
MRLKELKLRNFGPFKEYTIPFVSEDQACLLLTGRNNEGKTSLITALRILDAATRVINKTRQEIVVDDEYYYKLLKQDTEGLLIGRMVYNYQSTTAEIHGTFSDGFRLSVYLDPEDEIVYTSCNGRVPSDIQKVFGFIPPLGPISEVEDVITKPSYLRANFRTSLAPRHLRNHFFQILTSDEYSLVKDIIDSSWEGIKLLDYEIDYEQNRINCYFKEGRITREISWAGQGLQVWFQIITHLVRLRNTSILILDEPEVNLHPEKQNDLIRIIRDYYNGSIIIATHSAELMNNVSVSHIVNIRKTRKQPTIKASENRINLELVRSQIGSSFNLIASQFENFDLIIFTEDEFDFHIINELAKAFGIRKKAFNIPLHGFSENKKALPYKHAYEMLIGGSIKYTVLLDRDYYPEEYLTKTKKALEEKDIRTLFTIGKEIENIFLSPNILLKLIPSTSHKDFFDSWDALFEKEHLDCHSTLITLHEQFLPKKLDTKTIIKKYTPQFNTTWQCKDSRHNMITGKKALKRLRGFYQEICGRNLTQKHLLDVAVTTDSGELKKFIKQIYHET